MDDSDEALMARIGRGDEAAFRALSRRHLASVVALARHIVRNGADAEDIAQEAMLRVWTHAPRWQPLASFRTWLTRIVVNLCLDRKRRATPLPLDVAGDPADNTPGVEQQLEASEADRRVNAAIDALPPRQRAAIALTYRDGLSNAEAAEALGTSVSALETLLVRAKQKLRSELRDDLTS
ncbi:MAG: RNA polymerase sigma factor [Pseudolabrys sp.]|nr:RNA polymerase sigma factor [Pseudolabrys sp.]MCW5684596.1 RNA polymerase sigma factor [Pseudolabrys sp.]